MVGVLSSIPTEANFFFTDFKTPWCHFCTEMPEMSELFYLEKQWLYAQ